MPFGFLLLNNSSHLRIKSVHRVQQTVLAHPQGFPCPRSQATSFLCLSAKVKIVKLLIVIALILIHITVFHKIVPLLNQLFTSTLNQPCSGTHKISSGMLDIVFWCQMEISLRTNCCYASRGWPRRSRTWFGLKYGWYVPSSCLGSR